MRKSPLLQVLLVPSFFFLIASEFFSQVAMNLLNFILLLIAFNLSKSNTAVAGVVLSFTLPSILFGILAGVYVDRWNKKNVLMWTNFLRGLAIIPLVFVAHSLFLIYGISFLVSIVTQFFVPAETPIIPLLVEKKLLISANALFGMGIFGSMIVAYALSGPLLLFLGDQKVLILLVVLFILSGIFAFLIRLKHKESLKKQNFVEEFISVLGVIRRSKKIYHSLIILALVQLIILVIAVIGPGYAEHVLKIQVEKFPIIFVTPAVIGMAIGAVLIGNYFPNISREWIRRVGLALIGITFIIFPHGPLIASKKLPQLFGIGMLEILVIMALILGFSLALVFIPSNTVLQEETSDEERGKIYGALNSFVGAMSIIPVLAAGSLADIFGVTKVLTVIGVLLLLLVFLRISSK